MKWSANLAFAVGLITTDGNLSKDGRHITLVSKDIDQLQNFAKCLNLVTKISLHHSSYNPKGKYYHLAFSNSKLYKFLVSIGLTPHKTMTIGDLYIPDKYFFDFLRGNLDGDGNISVVSHPKSKHPQLRLRFCSVSLLHITWLKIRISKLITVSGGFLEQPGKSRVYKLTFAKADAILLLDQMYLKTHNYDFLSRKYKIYEPFKAK